MNQGRSQVPEGGAGLRTAFGPLVDVSPDVISLLDAKGEVLFHSIACEAVFGYPLEGLVGRSAFLPIHPEDHDRVSASMAEAVASAVNAAWAGSSIQAVGATSASGTSNSPSSPPKIASSRPTATSASGPAAAGSAPSGSGAAA